MEQFFFALERLIGQNTTLLWLLFIAFILWLITTFRDILSHWHHTFDKTNFSALDCYAKVLEGLKARDMPGLVSYRTTYRESVIFGAKREYLRVKRDDYIFDICVAPFGTGMYASWWLVTETNRISRIFRRFPIISYFYTHITYHEIDTEIMFRDLVHCVFIETLDAMTETQGVRMTEYERRIHEYPSLSNRKR